MTYKPIKPSYRAFREMHTHIRKQYVSSVEDIARTASLLMSLEHHLGSPSKFYLKFSSKDYLKILVQSARDILKKESKYLHLGSSLFIVEEGKEKFDYCREIIKLGKRGAVKPATTGDLAEAIYQIAEKNELFNTGLRALMYLETKCSEKKIIPQLVIKLVGEYKDHILKNPTVIFKEHKETVEADLERITKEHVAFIPKHLE